MWVPPDTQSVNPSYQQLDINTELAKGGLVPVASGQGHDASISIRQRDAVLWAGHLRADETVTMPDDRHVHLFVATGMAELDDQHSLLTGDAARLTGTGPRQLTAGPEGAEVLIWATA